MLGVGLKEEMKQPLEHWMVSHGEDRRGFGETSRVQVRLFSV